MQPASVGSDLLHRSLLPPSWRTSLLFPRRLCQRSTPSTPLGSSGLLLQVLHPFHGLRQGRRDSAPSLAPCAGSLSTRQASLYAADRWLAPSQRGLDPALRRPDLSERRRAATKVTWFLLRPDLHRLVIVNFQDAISPGLLALDLGCAPSYTTLPSAFALGAPAMALPLLSLRGLPRPGRQHDVCAAQLPWRGARDARRRTTPNRASGDGWTEGALGSAQPRSDRAWTWLTLWTEHMGDTFWVRARCG